MFHVEHIARATGLSTSPPILRSDLSADQVTVYDAVLTWHRDPNARQYLKVGGYAGTGKTTLVGALAKALEQLGEHITYAAFTGKAVNVLQKKLAQVGISGNFSTLHSLMYKPELDPSGKIIGWTKEDEMPYTFIIVDEASMVGAELWEDLLSYGLPILAVGDHGQLPPIGDSVVNLMARPDLRLEKIHRQAAGNPILALAQHVREGKLHTTFESTDSRVSFVPSVSMLRDKLVTADMLNFGAICYTNRTRASLNKYIRQARSISSVYPVDTDTVICLKNRKPIFNGMRGQLVNSFARETDSYDNFQTDIDFADDNMKISALVHMPQFGNPKTIDDLGPLRLKYNNPSFNWSNLGLLFDYGYALTCHKAQGSQFKDVVIVWENFFRDADTRSRWMYTAVTRAAEQLYIVKP